MVDEKIQVAFCFDINMFAPACVSVASLLDSKNVEEHYHIHCIIDEDSAQKKDVLYSIVRKRDIKSVVSFYPMSSIFESGYETRGISKATYMRFVIHRLIPNVNKVIYSDVDVLFCGSLSELWRLDLEKSYFAGVKGTNNFSDKWNGYKKLWYYDELDGLQGRYINAGVLMMNLQRIRKSQIENEWIERTKRQYVYQDQDIINITCKNQIVYLPLKYNLAAYLIPQWFKKYYNEGIYSQEECMEAYANPIILHYAGEKPWNERDAHRADMWWDYVQSQEDLIVLFPKLKKNLVKRVMRRTKHLLSDG